MATTFCVSGAVLAKAGAGRNTDLDIDQTNMDKFINQAESLINVVCRYNWTDVYATLDDDVKKVLEMVASDLAAIYVINYDMGGYTSRTEAEDMINVLRDSALRGISIMRDKKQQRFVKDPSTQTL